MQPRIYPVEDIRRWLEVDRMSCVQVGRLVGVSPTMIRNVCTDNQIVVPRPGHRQKNRIWPVDQIRQWVGEGKTLQWVAEQLHCRNQTISKVCRRHGIETHRTGPRAAEGHPEWKGGTIRYGKDLRYIAMYCPGHPHTRKPQKKYVPVHRLIVEAHMNGIGLRTFVLRCRAGEIAGFQFLQKSQVVHHKKGYKNRLLNLQVYESNGEHLAETLKGQRPNWTPEGKERILESVRRPYSRQKSKSGALPSNQTSVPMQAAPDTLLPIP